MTSFYIKIMSWNLQVKHWSLVKNLVKNSPSQTFKVQVTKVFEELNI